KLRVVAEAAGGVDRVEVPAARDRVAGPGDGEALKRARREDHVERVVVLEGKVGDDPAVLERVVHDHRIAEVVAITRIAEIALADGRIERERGDVGSGCLVEYADGRVDGLDEIGGTHVTVGVGRVPRTPGVEVQSRDAGQRTRRRSARC